MLDTLGAIYRGRGRAVPPRPGADVSLRTTAYLIAYDSGTYTATVSVLGSEPIESVPAVPSTYTGVSTVYVLMQGGRPVQVLGPASEAVVGEDIPTPPGTTSGGVRAVTGLTVGPSGTGTWRVTRSAWDRWNTVGDVYQYGSTASGTLYGLAWYGDQIASLGASTISRATLTVVSSGNPGAGAWTATVQGCASGTRPAGAPTFTGSTQTVSIPSAAGGVATLDLGSTIRAGLADGSLKSLGLSGAVYGGTRGAAPSWYLSLDCEVPA